MSLLQGFGEAGAPRTEREAARQLEAMLLKQLLSSSGAFKGSSAAGGSLHADLFAEALADAVAQSGGFGLGDALLHAPAAPPALAGPARLPIAGRQTSGFGTRLDPLTGAPAHHAGVDLASGEGTPIAAVAAGVVSRAGDRGGYGNAVEVDHGDGLTTLYAHAAELRVKEGERVQPGQTLATVGHSGRSTGNHLHFEVRLNGRAVDPLRALKNYQQRVDGQSDGSRRFR